MWICPNCETINANESCIICQMTQTEAKKYISVPQKRTEPKKEQAHTLTVTGARKKSKSLIVVISVLLVLCCCVAGGFIFVESRYREACELMEENRAQDAKQIFNSLFSYKNSDALADECDYKSATWMMSQGRAQDAKEIFVEIADYKDSMDKISECDYISANWMLSEGRVQEAREIFVGLYDYKDSQSRTDECDYVLAKQHMEAGELSLAADEFYALGDYKDSEQLLIRACDMLYEYGKEKYYVGAYTEAEECFEQYLNYIDDSECYAYLRLVDVRHGDRDASEIYDLIGFADTAEILSDSEHIGDFLFGRWEDGYGNYLELYNEQGDSTTWCSQNLMSGSGEHWKIENSRHYTGSDENGWNMLFKYTLLSKNKIRADCSNGDAYILYRQ